MKFRRRTHFEKSPGKPMVIVGAGPLVSPVWKSGNEISGWQYRFGICHPVEHNNCNSTELHPLDLVHIVKLIQVLAAVIVDDGCISSTERVLLKRLASKLDQAFGSDFGDELVIQ